MGSIQEHTDHYAVHLVAVERKQFLANTFEFPHLLAATNKMMADVADETEELRRLWKVAEELNDFIAACREQQWDTLRPDVLEDETKAFQKRIRSGGSRKTKASGTFRGLDKQIRDFLNTMPLIAALRHKSMRPRHWELLKSGEFICASNRINSAVYVALTHFQ